MLPVVTTYRAKTDLSGFAKKTLTDMIIPAGSTLEWQRGDYAGGLASVLWLRRRVLVMESELFSRCERVDPLPSSAFPKLPCEKVE